MGPACKPKVLLVEDNADVRRLYAIGLNQRGFEVKLAANGAEAVDRVATERPDFILLDWMMPLMDGREVVERLDHDERAIDGREFFERAAADEAFATRKSLGELLEPCGTERAGLLEDHRVALRDADQVEVAAADRTVGQRRDPRQQPDERDAEPAGLERGCGWLALEHEIELADHRGAVAELVERLVGAIEQADRARALRGVLDGPGEPKSDRLRIGTTRGKHERERTAGNAHGPSIAGLVR